MVDDDGDDAYWSLRKAVRWKCCFVLCERAGEGSGMWRPAEVKERVF